MVSEPSWVSFEVPRCYSRAMTINVIGLLCQLKLSSSLHICCALVLLNLLRLWIQKFANNRKKENEKLTGMWSNLVSCFGATFEKYASVDLKVWKAMCMYCNKTVAESPGQDHCEDNFKLFQHHFSRSNCSTQKLRKCLIMQHSIPQEMIQQNRKFIFWNENENKLLSLIWLSKIVKVLNNCKSSICLTHTNWIDYGNHLQTSMSPSHNFCQIIFEFKTFTHFNPPKKSINTHFAK